MAHILVIDRMRLVRVLHDETVLAEAEFSWKLDETYTLALQIVAALGARFARPALWDKGGLLEL